MVFLDTTAVTPVGESTVATAAPRWSLCGVFLYDEKQLAQGDEPATCRRCQRYTTATSYLETPRRNEDCEEGDLIARPASAGDHGPLAALPALGAARKTRPPTRFPAPRRTRLRRGGRERAGSASLI